MTQERQPNQGGQIPDGSYPSSTQVPSATNPEPIREPWDPRREPQGAPMPWEEKKPNDKDEQQQKR